MKTTSSIEINRPVEEVWKFFDNPDNMPLWLEGFKRFKPISGVPGQVGAKSMHVYEVRGRTFEMIEEITKRDPLSEFSGILTNEMMTSTIVNRFEDLGNVRTALRATVETRFVSPLYRLMGPMMKGGFQKRQDADLARLKKAIEP